MTRGYSALVTVIPKSSDALPFEAVGLHISQGGMYIHTSYSLPEQTSFFVEVIPNDGERPFRALARVVLGRGSGFECVFSKISRWSLSSLTRWLGRSGGLLPVAGTIHA